jgi:DNA-binding transcriptional ArsR family regulator
MPDPQDMIFRSLADPTRRGLFVRLCRDGEATVSALTAGAGVSQPVVSKHLAILKAAGLVQGSHRGRETHYRAEIAALAPLNDWAGEMTGYWNRRLNDLENLLNRMDQ